MDKEETAILFVDDEPSILNALSRLLMDEKYSILTANSGQDGLALLEKQAVQIVISDFRMPGMNGVEFLSEVRKRWPDTVRIVLSGYADSSVIVSAINEGQVYKFIPKPWNNDDLRVTISNSVERYYLHRKNKELAEELSEKNDNLMRLNAELNKLLAEKTENLAFRDMVLAANQRILDSLPIGILGVDCDGMIVTSNAKWLELMKHGYDLLGRNAEEVLSQDLIGLIDRARGNGVSSMLDTIGGQPCLIKGTVIRNRDLVQGIMIAIIPKEDLR